MSFFGSAVVAIVVGALAILFAEDIKTAMPSIFEGVVKFSTRRFLLDVREPLRKVALSDIRRPKLGILRVVLAIRFCMIMAKLPPNARFMFFNRNDLPEDFGKVRVISSKWFTEYIHTKFGSFRAVTEFQEKARALPPVQKTFYQSFSFCTEHQYKEDGD